MSRQTVEPLALRVRPKPYEGGASLLGRLAARHRDGDLAAFCHEHGLSLRKLGFGRGVERLAMLARVDATDLLLSSPKVDARSRSVRIGHTVVGLADWSKDGGRYCPHCVREDVLLARAAGRDAAVDVHRRLWWDVLSVTRCPTHGTGLSAGCPRCGARPAWGCAPGRCRLCGCSLAAPRPPDPRGPAGFSEYAAARLAGWPTDVPLFGEMDLREAVPQMERLGLVITGPLSALKPRRDAAAAAEIREVAFRALVSWPTQFVAALDRGLARSRDGGTGTGLTGTYGWAYEHWAAKLEHASVFGSAVRSAMRGHAIKHGVISDREGALLSTPSPRDPGISGAARSMGWSFARIKREASRRGLVPRGARRGVGIRISSQEVSTILREQAELVGIDEASRLLGIGKSQAGRIAAAGLLGPSEAKPTRIRREACEDLVRRLAAGANRLETRPDGILPLPAACQAAGVPLDHACRRILAGDVSPAGVVGDARTLAQVLVDPKALKPGRPDGNVSIEQAAAELRLHYQAARHLARVGLLGRRCGSATRVDRAGLARFRDAYVTGSEAAAMFGTSPKAVVSRLGRLSVVPVAAPPACRQVIFRRADVETAFHAVPGPAATDVPLARGVAEARSRPPQQG
ncbi:MULTISPECIES: TniQ family protein [Methylobacterium]|uniref:TniQ family protein n=1 Tax=Methylobacterium TaxID=407 RepID=UPI00272E4825|nr:TniQ family protein [Methylobacterium sp.]